MSEVTDRLDRIEQHLGLDGPELCGAIEANGAECCRRVGHDGRHHDGYDMRWLSLPDAESAEPPESLTSALRRIGKGRSGTITGVCMEAADEIESLLAKLAELESEICRPARQRPDESESRAAADSLPLSQQIGWWPVQRRALVPVDQTIMSNPDAEQVGNCLQASLATLLGLPLDEVPHFAEMDDWEPAMQSWLSERDHVWVKVSVMDVPKGMYCILTGVSPRGIDHAVVGVGDGDSVALVHDPHPSRDGLTTTKKAWLISPFPNIEWAGSLVEAPTPEPPSAKCPSCGESWFSTAPHAQLGKVVCHDGWHLGARIAAAEPGGASPTPAEPCPLCNDDGIVHDHAGNALGPCDCATPEPSPAACAKCGAPIFGGPGGWHIADGSERCGDLFHEPMSSAHDPLEIGDWIHEGQPGLMQGMVVGFTHRPQVARWVNNAWVCGSEVLNDREFFRRYGAKAVVLVFGQTT